MDLTERVLPPALSVPSVNSVVTSSLPTSKKGALITSERLWTFSNYSYYDPGGRNTDAGIKNSTSGSSVFTFMVTNLPFDPPDPANVSRY